LAGFETVESRASAEVWTGTKRGTALLARIITERKKLLFSRLANLS
jgi:hypothetical protein